jgi:hypothetical protein
VLHITITAIVSFVYGCGTWSISLKEEHSLGTFESKIPKKIFEPKKEEVIEQLWQLVSMGLVDLQE